MRVYFLFYFFNHENFLFFLGKRVFLGVSVSEFLGGRCKFFA